MKVWLLALAVLLAGCSDAPAADADGHDEGSDDGHGESGENSDSDADEGDPEPDPETGGEPGETNQTENSPPDIQVNVQSVGMDVEITVTLQDADADDLLSWEGAIDGEVVAAAAGEPGSEATIGIELAEGEHTYAFTITDGTDTGYNNGTFTVAPATVSQDASGSILTGTESCASGLIWNTAGTVPLASGSPTDGVSRDSFALLEGTADTTFSQAWTFDTGFITVYLFFTDAGGSIVQAHAEEFPAFGNHAFTGTVPEAAYVVMYACGGPATLEWTYSSS